MRADRSDPQRPAVVRPSASPSHLFSDTASPATAWRPRRSPDAFSHRWRLARGDRWSTCGLVRPPETWLPPEPIRYISAHMVRAAIEPGDRLAYRDREPVFWSAALPPWRLAASPVTRHQELDRTTQGRPRCPRHFISNAGNCPSSLQGAGRRDPDRPRDQRRHQPAHGRRIEIAENICVHWTTLYDEILFIHEAA